jgi:hypothetical protein
MSAITTTLPQNIVPIKTTTLSQIIAVLPSTILYPINVWLGGKLARYGQTSDNLIFLTDSEKDPTNEQMQYFNGLVASLDVQATLGRGWKNEAITAMRIYDNGVLIIDPTTLAYTQLVAPSRTTPILTVDELMSSLPTTIDWQYDIYLTGGVVKNGYSNNDTDMIVFDEKLANSELAAMRDFFRKAVGWKVDVGRAVMPEREPVYLYLLYSGGKLQWQQQS